MALSIYRVISGRGKQHCAGVCCEASVTKALSKSPTYTLVEPYEMEQASVYHFDLYRLGDPEELDFLGVRDYFESLSLCLIEWPDRGKGFLPAADIILSIEYLPEARIVTVDPQTGHGRAICKAIADRQGMLAEEVC